MILAKYLQLTKIQRDSRRRCLIEDLLQCCFGILGLSANADCKTRNPFAERSRQIHLVELVTMARFESYTLVQCHGSFQAAMVTTTIGVFLRLPNAVNLLSVLHVQMRQRGRDIYRNTTLLKAFERNLWLSPL